MIGTRAVEYHQGQRSYTAPKAGHMTAADQSDQTVENPLAKRPSTYDGADSNLDHPALGAVEPGEQRLQPRRLDMHAETRFRPRQQAAQAENKHRSRRGA